MVGNRAVSRLVQRYAIYRGGPNTLNNYTPRPRKEGQNDDVTGPKKGLSTFESFAAATLRASKAQIIETDNLGGELTAVRNGVGPQDTHVSILPTNDGNDEKLFAWAAAKMGDKTDHAYSRAVRAARTGEQAK